MYGFNLWVGSETKLSKCWFTAGCISRRSRGDFNYDFLMHDDDDDDDDDDD